MERDLHLTLGVPRVFDPPKLECLPSWKWMVGRWSLLSGWPIFRGYVSFREDKFWQLRTCLTGWNNLVRFSVSVMAFPVAAFCLLGRWALSRCFSQNRRGKEENFPLGLVSGSGILEGSKLITMTYRRYLKRWIFPYTFNAIGAFLQAGFASVCVIALQPMMCYSHPNGLRSFLPWYFWVDWLLDDVVLGMNLLPRWRVIWCSLCLASEKPLLSWTTRLASQQKTGLTIW